MTNPMKLKPCPFCGEAEHLSVTSCGSLTADMPGRPHRVVCWHIDHDEVAGPVAYGKQAAIEAWNTRAVLATLQSADPVEAVYRMDAQEHALMRRALSSSTKIRAVLKRPADPVEPKVSSDVVGITCPQHFDPYCRTCQAALLPPLRASDPSRELVERVKVAHGMLASFSGQPNHYGDVFKVLDAALATTTDEVTK